SSTRSLVNCLVHDLPRLSLGLESPRTTDDCVSGVPARHHRVAITSARHALDKALLDHLGRLSIKHCTSRAGFHRATTPRLSDVRRDCANSLSTGIEEKVVAVGLGG